MSLITPNRQELFEMAGMADDTRHTNPLRDKHLLAAAKAVQATYQPALLLVTLSEQGMLLAQRGAKPVVIPTVAQHRHSRRPCSPITRPAWWLAKWARRW